MKEKKNVKDLGEVPVWFYNISLDLFLRTCNAIGWSFQFKVCTGNCPLGSEALPSIDAQQIKLNNQLLVVAFLIQFWFETFEVKKLYDYNHFFLLLMQRSRVSAINLLYLYLSTNKKTLQASSFAAASPPLPKRPFLGMSYYLPCP